MTVINYRRVWERHTGLKIPAGWHIHHIDGDSSNHNPENLNCVSPTMHWYAHYLRGDPVALRGKFIQGAAEAGRLAEIKKPKRGRIWVICLETKMDKQVTKQKAEKLLSTGKWARGRTRGGFNTWDIGKARTVQLAGAKVSATKRSTSPEWKRGNSERTKVRWANPEYKAGIAKKISVARLNEPPEERTRRARLGGLALAAKRERI